MWSFDGSSTEQAPGNSSDCLLKPVAIFPDPDRVNAFLVMTEVLNADKTPHTSNGRSTIDDDDNDFGSDLSKNILIDVDTKYLRSPTKWIPRATRTLLLLCWRLKCSWQRVWRSI